MTAPTEDEVRVWLAHCVKQYEELAELDTCDNDHDSARVNESLAQKGRAALALLDEARKDREALTIADEWFACCDCITTETGTDERKKRYRELRRAAIDQARGA